MRLVASVLFLTLAAPGAAFAQDQCSTLNGSLEHCQKVIQKSAQKAWENVSKPKPRTTTPAQAWKNTEPVRDTKSCTDCVLEAFGKEVDKLGTAISQ